MILVKDVIECLKTLCLGISIKGRLPIFGNRSVPTLGPLTLKLIPKKGLFDTGSIISVF